MYISIYVYIYIVTRQDLGPLLKVYLTLVGYISPPSKLKGAKGIRLMITCLLTRVLWLQHHSPNRIFTHLSSCAPVVHLVSWRLATWAKAVKHLLHPRVDWAPRVTVDNLSSQGWWGVLGMYIVFICLIDRYIYIYIYTWKVDGATPMYWFIMAPF